MLEVTAETIKAYGRSILASPELEDKLISFKSFVNQLSEKSNKTIPLQPDEYHIPARSSRISFSDEQIKFPKKNSLKDPKQQAIALHSFANHELLAIEIMAKALIEFDYDRVKCLRVINTIEDEQKHFRLYEQTLIARGFQFGDFPINDFLWRHCSGAKNWDQFNALMGLTFEAANLDFALFYKKIFKKLGESEIEQILETVYQDEIKHVAFGFSALENSATEVFSNSNVEADLWEYYVSLLPWPITPARSKGIGFDREGRALAGLSDSFIEQVFNYEDSFAITRRKKDLATDSVDNSWANESR